ncbi:MAG TPA: hypothetical protein PK152_12155 [Anaerolineales bacterium]|nr:hypothetical protein [Anaerolineales bacterium]HRK89878.1 hypothetical protein [Anaerolineales bacterium]
MPLDINLSPLYRINNQEQAEMPGLLALMPPKNAARGREQDRLIVYLLLAGNSTFTTTEYKKLAEDAANMYYQTPRAVTSALRAAAEFVNRTLLERNMSTSAQGQYALAWLSLASVRESQVIFSVCGPMHAYWFGTSESRHFFEPAMSGKGLGSSQTLNIHYAQTDLNAGDLLLFCGRMPNAWLAPLDDAKPTSFEAMRRRLHALTSEDLNAVLIQPTEGTGAMNLIKGNATPKVEAPREEPTPQKEIPLRTLTEDLPPVEEVESKPAAHMVQPSAYAIPPEPQEANPLTETPADPLASLPHKTVPREFPASIPRAMPKPQVSPSEEPVEAEETESVDDVPVERTDSQVQPEAQESKQPDMPREPSQRTRQAAKAAVSLMQGFRNWNQAFSQRMRNFLPRLLPNAEAGSDMPKSSDLSMFAIAIIIPLIVGVILFVVYTKYGRNPQYESFLQQATQASQQAQTLANPIEQREAWLRVIDLVARAEAIHRSTPETATLRLEADANLDKLSGTLRMEFNPAFSTKLGIDVSRMAASDKDIYLLDAEKGEVLRAFPSGSGGFELDNTFNCKPGVYGNYTVGSLVDILALPVVNFINATLLGIDADGNLLYCAPGQVPQAIPLPPPDTNWGHVTAFTLDSGTLYVLDAQSRAVWVYNGKEGTYSDRPYFFFGQQTPTQDVIDFIISGDEMYLLHADGRLSNCSYSRISADTSKCQDPVPLINTLPAYQDTDLFGAANFTQILFAAPPDPSILLLDSDGQNVMRFAPRTFELQNQFRPKTGGANLIPQGSVGAVAVSPDHVLYIAVDRQIYFATNMP